MTPEICPTFLRCNRVSGGNAEDDDGFKHDWDKTFRFNVPLYDYEINKFSINCANDNRTIQIEKYSTL